MSRRSSIALHLYAPTFFVGFTTLALVFVEAGVSGLWLLPLLGAAIGVSLVAERLAPYDLSWNEPRGDVARDLIHAGVNELLNVGAVAIVPLVSALLPPLGLWPDHWPLALQLALAVFVADFGVTMVHFASHRLRWLWALHAVHHSVKRMYGFNGLMKHPLHQSIEVVAGSAPLLLLGLPMDIASLLGFTAAIQLLLQHSNVDMRVGVFGWLWAVAPGHRRHHVASNNEGDVNFGLFTFLWDHLLGTFRANPPRLRSEDMGVAGEPNYPASYWRQLMAPFVRSRLD